MVCAEKVAHQKKVMIWAAIGLNFKSELVFIEGPISSDAYFEQITIGSGHISDADKAYGQGQWVSSRITLDHICK